METATKSEVGPEDTVAANGPNRLAKSPMMEPALHRSRTAEKSSGVAEVSSMNIESGVLPLVGVAAVEVKAGTRKSWHPESRKISNVKIITESGD